MDALRGVSLEIERGKVTAVMGPSGSGKSTLMHILAGLDQPTSGTVTIAGREITSMSDNELTLLRRRHIGFVFQFYNLLPMLTAAENVKLPLTVAGVKVDEAWFGELIDKVGLSGRLKHRPSQLSGGQQQRVAIARALINRPTVVFADEPTGNLDSKSSAEILALLRESSEEYGQTLVMVTHDPGAAAIADRDPVPRRRADRGRPARSDGPRGGRDDERARLDRGFVTRIAIKDLFGRKLRLVLTSLAIVLGVAMVSGTYILTDTINAAFSSIFTTAYSSSDAVVTGEAASAGRATRRRSRRRRSPESAPCRALPRRRAASPTLRNTSDATARSSRTAERPGSRSASTQRVTSASTPSPFSAAIGPSARARSRWTRDRLRPARRGRWNRPPAATGRTGAPLPRFRNRPIRTFDARWCHARDLRLPHRAGALPQAGPAGPDLHRSQTRHLELGSAVPGPLGAAAPHAGPQRPAAGQAEPSDTSAALSFLRYFLLAFGGIALFVGAFVIANTLTITIAQRTREFATLRSMGAMRRQVLTVVIVEGLATGLFASTIGLFVGLGLAKGLDQLFKAFGADLPQAGLVFAGRTVIVSLLVGTSVTLIASLRPALRATRVPPIAAVREGSILPPGRFARFGPAVALGVCAVSGALVAYGSFGHGMTAGTRLLMLAGGVLGLFIGIAMLAPRVVRPLASVLGWPAARIGGVAGAAGPLQRDAKPGSHRRRPRPR